MSSTAKSSSARDRPHAFEAALDGIALGIFMVSACFFTALFEHPDSPVRAAVVDGDARRIAVGLAMGLTAVGLIYSPWGRRSGAHLNPSVTLAFARLGRVPMRDARLYVAAQFVGAAAGVGVAALFLGPALAHPAVRYAVTVPGAGGPLAAFAGEFAISAVLFAVVLQFAARARLERYTGWAAGLLVAAWISLEAPLSGMSMNPARTVGSALAAGEWTHLWIYFTAPPLAMLAVAESHRRLARSGGCAKLRHRDDEPCIFCGQLEAAATLPAHPTHAAAGEPIAPRLD